MNGKDTRLLCTEFYFWYVGGKYQIIAIVCEHGDRNNMDSIVKALVSSVDMLPQVFHKKGSGYFLQLATSL